MKKEELMYQYAYDAYKEQISRKKEIRDRSSTFFGLGTPIIVSIASISLSLKLPFSIIKIVLLSCAGLVYVLSIVFFLLIFLPSGQKSYEPSVLIPDTPINPDDIKGYLKYREYENTGEVSDNTSVKETDISDARTFLGLRFFVNIYSTLFDEYGKTLLKFRWYFRILAITLCLASALLALSLAF